MKVAIVGSNSIDSMESNLQEAFKYVGHKCVIFDIPNANRKIFSTLDKILRTYSERYDKDVFVRLAGKVENFNPDLVICVYRFIHPEFVRLLKKSRRKIVHINPDALTTFGYQQIFASDYDVWFTKDPYIVHFMRDNMHLNAVYYNEAFSPRLLNHI